MKRHLVTVCFAVMAVSAALAQQKKDVPPAPKPKDEGPSLEVTMRFIQEKISDVGPLNFVAYYHDNIAGNDWAVQFKNYVTKVVADSGACRISYHLNLERGGKTVFDLDETLQLKNVDKVIVAPMTDEFKRLATEQGHPSWDNRIDPPLISLRALAGKGGNYFDFPDEEMASRVAKAVTHAVELCGGGAKPEPF